MAAFCHDSPRFGQRHPLLPEGPMHRKLLTAAILTLSTQTGAQPIKPEQLPPELRSWTNWVLFDETTERCPFLNGKGQHHCTWPGVLSLSLSQTSGTFTQRVTVFRRTWLALPGDAEHWPQAVRVDEKTVTVVPYAGANAQESGDEDQDISTADKSPMVLLEPGEHRISGQFVYDDPPDSLRVPPSTALISLTVLGKPIPFPQRDEAGEIFMSSSAGEPTSDVVDIDVHRKVTDDIPLTLSTSISLKVSGKSRELLLSSVLPVGFAPMAIEGGLPARLEADGRLRVQIRPGAFVIEVKARSLGPVLQLKRPKVDGVWMEGDEVWVFESRPSLRQADIAGVVSVDASQTTLPQHWKALPAYAMAEDDTLVFSERRRGDADPGPDELTLSRQLWLDFDGQGVSMSDSLSGQLRRGFRLEMLAPTNLGHAVAAGADQPITTLTPTGQSGIELQQGQVKLEADSRLNRFDGTIPAVSWDADFRSVAASLNLPPGYRVVHLSGADSVAGTWITQWQLLDIFLVLVISLAFGRLFGWPFGALALGTLLLSWQEFDAPRYVWLAVLLGEALYRVLPNGKLRFAFSLYRFASWAALAIVVASFLVSNVRHAMYPGLAQERSIGGMQSYDDYSRENVEQLSRNVAWQDDNAASDSSFSISIGTKGRGGGIGDAEPSAKKVFEQIQEGTTSDTPAASPVPPPPPPPPGQKRFASQKRASQNVRDYDKNAVVQTGFGLPRWEWTRLDIRFSGPVQRSQQLRLFLISPFANVLLTFLRVLLLAAMVLVSFQLPGRFWPGGIRRVFRSAHSLSLAVLTLSLSALPASAGDMPDETKLAELRQRLLARPDCAPNCAAIPKLSVEAAAQTLRIRMEVHAAASTAVPLPGNAQQWVPQTVLVDGKPTVSMRRDDEGTIWVQLAAGVHQVILEGPLPELDTVQIHLTLPAFSVQSQLSGWRLDGVHEDSVADEDLQLSRELGAQKGKTAALQAGTLPPFVKVLRTLSMGINWSVTTRVVRLTPSNSAVVLEIPLLEGESVTTSDVRVVNQRALVNMSPDAVAFEWTSVLEPKSPLQLTAASTLSFVEEWNLEVTPVWHVTLSGVPVIHQQESRGPRNPSWRPWPGERVTILAQKPEGIAGQTVTIDQSKLSVTPGVRATDTVLTANLRSSRGGQHSLTLPPGAELREVTINGRQQPIRQEGERVSIPLTPGSSSIQLSWQQPSGWTWLWRTPVVALNLPTVNAEMEVFVGSDRWVLFAGGPRMGPAVLFWSYLLVLLVVSFALSRMSMTPLGTVQWLMLAVGLSQVPVAATAVVFGWLLFLGWRAKQVTLSAVWFDLRQLALIGITLVALGILAVSVYQGLLGQPSMQIVGNGSTASLLRWFADRTDSQLSSAYVVSVPVYVFRLAMLLWSLWMAIALLKWLKWGWNAFSTGGLWKALLQARPLPLVPPQAPPPPA